MCYVRCSFAAAPICRFSCGRLDFGLLGLFLGPVILAVIYTLLQHWIADKEHT